MMRYLPILLLLLLMVQVARADEEPLINLALNKPYQVLVPWPDALSEVYEKSYEDTGGIELTDGKKATTQYLDPAWRSFYRQGGRTIILDLGDVHTVNRITGDFLQHRDAGIYVPHYIDYYLSADGENYAYMGTVETSVGPWHRRVQKEEFTLDGLNHQARYVKLQFPTDVNVFMDELEVFGKEGIVPGSAVLEVFHEISEEEMWRKSAIFGPDVLPERGYIPKGSPNAGGAEHIVIAVYASPLTGDATWISADFIPYVAYISEDAIPQDWFFDTILLSPQGETPNKKKLYATEASHAATIEDWIWYLEETFKPDRQLSALNKAVDFCGNILQDKDHKVKVILSLVNPSPLQNNFGALEPGGKNLSFNHDRVGAEEAMENRLTAVEWLMDKLIEGFENGDTQYLELIGFYWHPEAIAYHQSPYEGEFVKKVSELVHSRGLKFFWIPFYGAPGSYDWHNFGFDAVMLQPSYMFSDSEEDRVRNAAHLASYLGMGVEMEKHWNDTLVERNKWRDYLNGGVKYGYINAVVGYYQNYKDFARAALSLDRRTLYYDYVYQFVKGTYKIPE
jgi:hypothetical protein